MIAATLVAPKNHNNHYLTFELFYSRSFATAMAINEISPYPPQILTNYIDGGFVALASNRILPVTNPYDGSVLTSVVLSNRQDLDIAVESAQKAFQTWSKTNVKNRILKLMKLHHLMTQHLEELAEMVVQEHGKNIVEAKASITKGMETLEVLTFCLRAVNEVVGYWVAFVSGV